MSLIQRIIRSFTKAASQPVEKEPLYYAIKDPDKFCAALTDPTHAQFIRNVFKMRAEIRSEAKEAHNQGRAEAAAFHQRRAKPLEQIIVETTDNKVSWKIHFTAMIPGIHADERPLSASKIMPTEKHAQGKSDEDLGVKPATRQDHYGSIIMIARKHVPWGLKTNSSHPILSVFGVTYDV